MSSPITVEVCPVSAYRAFVPSLAQLLKSTVEENVTMNFILPFSIEDATHFWLSAEDNLRQGKQFVIVAHEAPLNPTDEPVLLGCVILYLAQHPNAKHRAEVGKLIVAKQARKRGIGKLLLDCLEDEARKHSRTILILDTQTGSTAEKFYERMQWSRVKGVLISYCPDAHVNDGSCFTSITFFYKKLL